MADEDVGAPAPEATAPAPAPEGGAPAPEGGAPEAKAEGGGTALEAGGNGPEGNPAPSSFPETWRHDLAKHAAGADKGDAYDKEMKRLERMSSPADAYKSYRELENKVRSGELKGAAAEFPADGTDTDKAKWRQDNGIPADPKGYAEKLDGIAIGENMEPVVNKYLERAHEMNMSPDIVRENIDWYMKTIEAEAEERAAADASFHDASVEALRSEMGPEYKRNMGDLNNWLANAPEGLADNLFGARLADGSLLGDNPVALKWLVSQMREINPLSTVVPMDGGSGMQSVESEIAEIKNLIATDPNAYWRDKAKQDRYEKLLEARDANKKRSA